MTAAANLAYSTESTLSLSQDVQRMQGQIDSMTQSMSSVLDSGWSFGDVTFAGEPSSGIVRAVSFPTPLSGLAKELVASTPAALVVPDVAVDGLVADAEASVPLEPS